MIPRPKPHLVTYYAFVLSGAIAVVLAALTSSCATTGDVGRAEARFEAFRERAEPVLTAAAGATQGLAGGIPSLILTGLGSALAAFGATNAFRGPRNGSSGDGSPRSAA